MRDAEMIVERLIKRRQALRSLDRDYDERMSTRGELTAVPFSDPLSRMITIYMDRDEAIEEHTSASDESRIAQMRADHEAVQIACIQLQERGQERERERLKEKEKREREQNWKRLVAKQHNEKKRLKEKEKREQEQEAALRKRMQFAQQFPQLILRDFEVDISHIDLSPWVFQQRVRVGALSRLTRHIYTHISGLEFLISSWNRWVDRVEYYRSMLKRYEHKPHVIDRWNQSLERTRGILKARYSLAARRALEWQEKRGEQL
jgi:hypothetical protein